MDSDVRTVENNIQYICDIFSSFGINISEENNFKYHDGSLAIYLTHNGNSLLITYDTNKRWYNLAHLNKGHNLSQKHHYHYQRSYFTVYSLASGISTLHKPSAKLF